MLRMEENHAEEVVEVVGDAHGHPAQRFEAMALGLAEGPTGGFGQDFAGDGDGLDESHAVRLQ